MRVKKQLISVGKGGIKPSHVRSLNSLIAAHTLVKVKVCIRRRLLYRFVMVFGSRHVSVPDQAYMALSDAMT